jgi:RNA polymerase-binding transcription factor
MYIVQDLTPRLRSYKQRLLAMEEELSSRMKRTGVTAREPADDSTSDAGDESVNNERKEEQLWKVDTDRTMLSQVQDALERIENGTFGNCLADGEPIDEKRLEAMPRGRGVRSLLLMSPNLSPSSYSILNGLAIKPWPT